MSIMSSSSLLLYLALFARLSGFFIISPLFSERSIPLAVRFGLAFVCSLLLAPPMHTLSFDPSPLWTLLLIKEVLVGYLIGFLFSLIFEAAALAGQVVGTLGGFSATELVDPLANSSQPLISRLFVLTVFVLFLGLDLHHSLLRFLFESFSYMPIGYQVTWSIVEASAHLFHQAILYAAVPITFLGALIFLFGIVARFFPDLPIFFVGFPIQLLVGFIAIALALLFFTEIVQNSFFEWLTLAKKVFAPYIP